MPDLTSSYQDAEALKQLTLGKTTEYVSQYSPELLQAIPRSLNRNELKLTANNLPFIGEDIWYGYEISWLNNKGKPQVAVGEFRFPATSVAIVESKSFKLYLNSFNQSRFASVADVEQIMRQDLSKAVAEKVQVTLFNVEQCPALNINHLTYHCIDELDIEINHYDLEPAVLTIEQTNTDLVSENLVSHLLKSNCLITNQPDWASIYISYRGQKIPHEALLRYLISFRQHNEFHEQCVERIFTDLNNNFQLDELSVFARYTRRGGLDINPFRSTHIGIAPNARTLRQ